jgi:hypothetical protein
MGYSQAGIDNRREDIICNTGCSILREIAGYRPYVFTMNVYRSHRIERILATTEAEDVEILFVPAGGVGRFQPVDRRTFGELKARVRTDFPRRFWREGSETMDHQTSVDILEKSWASFPSYHVQKAGNIV